MQPYLSICIPTWNRDCFLRKSLECFINQIKDVSDGDIELLVSDNASDDNTPQVVHEFIEKGLPIIYNRNESNLGADGNFLKCMHLSNGKYIFLLGDDDILKPGALKKIVEMTKSGDYGLIHLHEYKKLNGNLILYSTHKPFFVQLSIWITFMSGNIFLKEAVDKVKNPEKFMKTSLLQVPFYIQSALLKQKNLIVNQTLFEYGLDDKSNGGYNFFGVFLNNFMSIWKNFLDDGTLSKGCYEAIKKKIYFSKLIDQVWYLLILKTNVVKSDKQNKEFRSGYLIDNAWKYLLKFYGKNSYFYCSFLIMPFLAIYRSLGGRIVKALS